jgi:hypothetical protein
MEDEPDKIDFKVLNGIQIFLIILYGFILLGGFINIYLFVYKQQRYK